MSFQVEKLEKTVPCVTIEEAVKLLYDVSMSYIRRMERIERMLRNPGLSEQERIELEKLRSLVMGYYQPPLLWGPPGVGKTMIVKELAIRIAHEIGAEFLDLDSIDPREAERIVEEAARSGRKLFLFKRIVLSQYTPSKILGLPEQGRGHTIYNPIWWAKFFAQFPGVLFIDELTNPAPPEMKSLAYKLLIENEAGDVKLHPLVIRIAAANPPTHWSSYGTEEAEELGAGMRSRFMQLFVVPDVGSFINYLMRNYARPGSRLYLGDTEFFKKLVIFLKAFPDSLWYRKDPYVVSPRTWENMLRWLAEKIETAGGGRAVEEWQRLDREGLLEAAIRSELPPEIASPFLVLLKEISVDPNEAAEHADKFGEMTRSSNLKEKIRGYLALYYTTFTCVGDLALKVVRYARATSPEEMEKLLDEMRELYERYAPLFKAILVKAAPSAGESIVHDVVKLLALQLEQAFRNMLNPVNVALGMLYPMTSRIASTLTTWSPELATTVRHYLRALTFAAQLATVPRDEMGEILEALREEIRRIPLTSEEMAKIEDCIKKLRDEASAMVQAANASTIMVELKDSVSRIVERLAESKHIAEFTKRFAVEHPFEALFKLVWRAFVTNIDQPLLAQAAEIASVMLFACSLDRPSEVEPALRVLDAVEKSLRSRSSSESPR